MAIIDFTNAKIECYSADTYSMGTYLNLYGTSSNFTFLSLNEQETSSVVQTLNKSVVNDEKRGFTVTYSGTMNTSGTGFIIGSRSSSGTYRFWKVTGINFNAGDTFSFSVRVDLPSGSE